MGTGNSANFLSRGGRSRRRKSQRGKKMEWIRERTSERNGRDRKTEEAEDYGGNSVQEKRMAGWERKLEGRG